MNGWGNLKDKIMKKTCKNCFCWKKKEDEPQMGYCLKSSKITKVRPVKSGIAIRFKDGDSSNLDYVVFGKNFGCIYFENN